MAAPQQPLNACPCGSAQPFNACCGVHLAGIAAPTPHALMRSRYTAFTLHDAPYLLATWHASTRPATLTFDSEAEPKWLGLKLIAHQLQDEHHASVEFVARSKHGGRAHRLHEVSRFVREDGRWFYVDGVLDPA